MTTGLATGGRKAFQTLALWLGLFALTIQGLAPLLCTAAMAGGVGGNSIVICTAHGFETRSVGADGRPLSNAPDSGHQGSDCLLCSVCHMGGGFTTPSPILMALPSFVERAPSLLVSSPAILRPAHFAYVSRAPPGAAASLSA